MADLRELLDADVLDEIELELQCRSKRLRARSLDGLHDLLLRLGDLTKEEVVERSTSPEVAAQVDDLVAASRAIRIEVAGSSRYAAAEHASQYRDALGVSLPPGLPKALLAPEDAPLDTLALRYARTHGPFTTMGFSERYGLDATATELLLRTLSSADRLIEGDFRPGGTRREWCAPDVLRQARSRSLARLRHQIEPVEPSALGRFLTRWQGVGSGRRGLDALLDEVEHLQGAPLPASTLETVILPARLADYDPRSLDTLASAGEVCWIGVESIGQRDGRIALYLTDHLSQLVRPREATAAPALGSESRDRQSWTISSGKAPRISVLFTTRAAAAILVTPSTRCGRSSGGAWSRMTHFRRCGPLRSRPTDQRGRRFEAPPSVRGGSCRRLLKADGR